MSGTETIDVLTCAAPGCDEHVVRTGRGRAGVHVVVEVDHQPTPDNERPTGRVWIVRLRRGTQSVVIAAELGRPSADLLAGQLNELLATRRRVKGAAME
jgi:hypothetical protein